jgi:pimeloyl-ACP methyl ester carboxylesterase
MAELGTGSVQANGIAFHYLEVGHGPLVLCRHGFPDNAHTYDALRPVLAGAGFRAVAPVHAWLCADLTGTRRPLPISAPRSGRGRADSGTRGDASLHPSLRTLQERVDTTPTPVRALAIHGTKDRPGRLEAFEGVDHLFAKGVEKLILPGTGHFLHLERPDEVARRIVAFLKQP